MAGKERNIKVVIEDVKKTYMGRNGEVVALNGVNLEIAHNEFVTVRVRQIDIAEHNRRTA